MSNTAAGVKYKERELAADAIPTCTESDFIIPGDAGLVRCIILNDRLHALAVDTLGEVGVWDIIRGTCICLRKSQQQRVTLVARLMGVHEKLLRLSGRGL